MRRNALMLVAVAGASLGPIAARAQSPLSVFGPDSADMLTMAFTGQSTLGSPCSAFAMTPCLIREPVEATNLALQTDAVDLSTSAFLRERTEPQRIDLALVYPATPAQVARGTAKPGTCWAGCNIAQPAVPLLAQSGFANPEFRVTTLASAAYDALDEGALAPPVGSAAYPMFRNSVQLKLHIANYDVSTFKIFEWRPAWRPIR
ncbi:MAG: hypothetical protein U1E70_04435 [Acetobacteraceae bacterium]|nr:hypothetical protein [Pseudomonadota bacterium]